MMLYIPTPALPVGNVANTSNKPTVIVTANPFFFFFLRKVKNLFWINYLFQIATNPKFIWSGNDTEKSNLFIQNCSHALTCTYGRPGYQNKEQRGNIQRDFILSSGCHYSTTFSISNWCLKLYWFSKSHIFNLWINSEALNRACSPNMFVIMDLWKSPWVEEGGLANCALLKASQWH